MNNLIKNNKEPVWLQAVKHFPYTGEVEQQVAFIKSIFGLNPPRKHRKHRRHNPFEILSAYKQYKTIYSTAKNLNISTNLVWYWLRRLGR